MIAVLILEAYVRIDKMHTPKQMFNDLRGGVCIFKGYSKYMTFAYTLDELYFTYYLFETYL